MEEINGKMKTQKDQGKREKLHRKQEIGNSKKDYLKELSLRNEMRGPRGEGDRGFEGEGT